MRGVKRVAALVAIIVLLMGVAVEPASALWGDVYCEGLNNSPYGWRGVGGDIWAYDWALKPSGRHVSSLYVHDVPYNPFPWDGYSDGLLHNWVHMEVGVLTRYGGSPTVFWQYNKTPGGFDDWAGADYATIPATGVWVSDFKIGNVSMGSSSPQTWHMNWSGHVMKSPSMPLVTGVALCSSERYWKDNEYPPDGDSNKASFKGLERKNSLADWKLWMNAIPMADGDEYYHYSKTTESELFHGRY